jgi:hypothetical protein
MVLGDMHHAVVAVGELLYEGVEPTAVEVANRLRWYQYKLPGGGVGVPDVRRAETAMLAAHEHNHLEYSSTR